MILKSRVLCGLVMLAGGGLLLLGWAVNRIYPESAPIARGAAYAETRGCFGCHGDPGNPLPDANDTECSNVNRISGHPDYTVDCSDVMAYFEALRLRRNIDARAHVNADGALIGGEQLVRKYHCFQCHGQLGQGGFENAKSLKGYVPGYFGDDFKTLTNNADPDSVREWIMHGLDPDIVATPILGRIAEFFFRRQAIHMPSYKSLEPGEIEILVNYVISINQFGPMTAETVRSYGERSTSPEQLASYHSRQNARVD